VDAGDAAGVACAIRSQHEALFTNAVAPGFDEVTKSGLMSATGREAAQAIVPAGAALFRDRNLIEILDEIYGDEEADRIYSRYVATCGGNTVIDNLPNVDIGPGDVIRFPVKVMTFAAGSLVDYIFTSEPVYAGQATVAPDGTMNVEVTVPDTLPSGPHILHVQGTSPGGVAVEVRQPLVVKGGDEPVAADGVIARPARQSGGGGVPIVVPFGAVLLLAVGFFVYKRRKPAAS
jgi:hypothetical protein